MSPRPFTLNWVETKAWSGCGNGHGHGEGTGVRPSGDTLTRRNAEGGREFGAGGGRAIHAELLTVQSRSPSAIPPDQARGQEKRVGQGRPSRCPLSGEGTRLSCERQVYPHGDCCIRGAGHASNRTRRLYSPEQCPGVLDSRDMEWGQRAAGGSLSQSSYPQQGQRQNSFSHGITSEVRSRRTAQRREPSSSRSTPAAASRGGTRALPASSAKKS